MFRAQILCALFEISTGFTCQRGEVCSNIWIFEFEYLNIWLFGYLVYLNYLSFLLMCWNISFIWIILYINLIVCKKNLHIVCTANPQRWTATSCMTSIGYYWRTPGGGDGCPVWYVNSWALGWSRKSWARWSCWVNNLASVAPTPRGAPQLY